MQIRSESLLLASLMVALAVIGRGQNAAAQGPGSAGTRAIVAGWNLVSIPPAATFSVAPQTVLSLQGDGTAYAPFNPGDVPSEGRGYWAFLNQPSTLSMPAPLNDGVTVTLAVSPGEWVLIGDTTGFYPGFVSGADAVYTYDPETGYRQQSVLFPGQGAWAMSLQGGTISIGSGSPSGPPPGQDQR
jgi:hypothetical protein